jgi:hypothetical protein
MEEEIVYQQEIKQYSLDELMDVLHHIDRQKFPKRFQIVVEEIKKRKGGVLVQKSSLSSTEHESVIQQEERIVTSPHSAPTPHRHGSTFVTVVAWIFIVIAGFTTVISVLQNIMLNMIFPIGEINMASEALTDLPLVHRVLFSN